MIPKMLLLFLYFLSGFSALCYQLAWQRMLFAAFGMNMESVTIIVSLFMLGLGMGALAGSRLQQYTRHLLRLFICFELGISLFGMLSPWLVSWLGGIRDLDSPWSIALCVYALFGLPTALMGATLPVLVGYLDRDVGHAGKSTGWLYASNTLGAAAASYLIVKVFFVWGGLHATLGIAAFLNLLTAATAWHFPRKDTASETIVRNPPAGETPSRSFSSMLLLILGFCTGYISLSQELVWYRVLGFLSMNRPQVFGFLLASFLAAIALASIAANGVYAHPARKYGLVYLVSGLLCWYAAFPAVAFVTSHYGNAAGLTTGFALAGATAFFLGGVFPVLCHSFQLATRQSSASAVGAVYCANIAGATLGPLVTGFILFDALSLQSIIFLIGFLTAMVIGLWAVKDAGISLRPFRIIALCAALTVLGYALKVTAYDNFFEKLQFATPSPKTFDNFNANKSGIISVAGKAVFGNGAYGGKINIDPAHNINGIDRAYAIATFQPNPRRILQIGLGSGSWANAMTLFPPLEELTVVEINKGYLEVIGHYPVNAGLLHHPKVRLVIDDGRRWLRNHPGEQFDMIVASTIYFWRSNATNLLSREFMELCRQHLNPGGYVYINHTGAAEVAYTAAHVFAYVASAPGNMVLAGDASSEMDKQAKTDNLEKFTYPDGRRVFQDEKLIDEIAGRTYPNQKEALLQQTNQRIITDDNMATEFKK